MNEPDYISKLDPDVLREIQKQHLQKSNGWNMPIGPAKPDPEAAVNAQINTAAVRPQPTAAELGQVNQDLNGILGTSGGVPQEQVSPEQRARLDQQRDKLEMMKKFYQNKSNGQ